MALDSKKHFKKITIVLLMVFLVFVVAVNSPLHIPCLWKLFFNIQSPACGLTRSFILASQFKIVDAIKMNILFLPLFIGAMAYYVCTAIDAFANKQTLKHFNLFLSKKWVIAIAVGVMILSWYYNIVRGI